MVVHTITDPCHHALTCAESAAKELGMSLQGLAKSKQVSNSCLIRAWFCSSRRPVRAICIHPGATKYGSW